MKKKHSPKLKIEEIHRQIKNDVLTCLGARIGINPDKIAVQEDGSAEVYFAPDNPQTKIAVRALITLEREGFISFVDELLWNGPGFDVTSVIRVNKERVALLRVTRWGRFKEFLGLNP